MFQIDNPSAVSELPAPTAEGTPGFFTDGDPSAGIVGTIVPAELMNAIMLELCNVVTGVGGTLLKSNNTQIANSLPAAGTGYLLFPSGLIVNYGGGSNTDNTGAEPVTFARPFTTGSLFAIAGNATDAGPPVGFHGTGNITLTGMTVYSSTGPGSIAAAAGISFRWLAIGF